MIKQELVFYCTEKNTHLKKTQFKLLEKGDKKTIKTDTLETISVNN